MIRKTKLHRILALVCAIVCVFTSFVFPVSAASDILLDISLSEPSGTKAWFPGNDEAIEMTGNNYVAYSKSFYSINEVDTGLFGITLDSSFNSNRNSMGTDSHFWSALLFNVTNTTNISNVDLSKYDLKVDFSLDYQPSGSYLEELFLEDVNKLSVTLGLSSSDINALGGGIPRIGDFSGYELSSENLFYIDDYVLYNTFVFTDTDDITSILDGSFIFGVPFSLTSVSTSISLTMDVTLVYTGTSTDVPEDITAPDVTDEPDDPDEPNTDVPVFPSDNFGFSSPESYSYDTRFYFTPLNDGQITDGYEVTDFYLQNNSIRFKDTTDSIFTVSWPWDGYSLYYSFTYADGYTASDFTDTIFRTYTVNLETQLSTDLIYTGADLSKYGFRLHFYIECGDSVNFDFAEFKNYVEKASTSFYGFEPFSIKAGSVVIPFEYWKLEFNATNSCIRATLELDGKNAAHESFMRALASNQQDVSINFTLGNDTTFLFGTGENSNGFWIKYSDSSVTPDNPDTPTTGGFSQEDLDAAFNKGYNKGAADNGGTNYVFAFVNGLWSGFGQFYSLVTNGISIGGISLNMIITSIIIIAVFVIVIKKVT